MIETTIKCSDGDMRITLTNVDINTQAALEFLFDNINNINPIDLENAIKRIS